MLRASVLGKAAFGRLFVFVGRPKDWMQYQRVRENNNRRLVFWVKWLRNNARRLFFKSQATYSLGGRAQ
jgi:hypothetical protein